MTPRPEDAAPIILFETPKNPSGGEVVLLSICEFNSTKGIDCRAHYRKKDGTYSISRKGIRLSPAVWKTLLPEISKAVAAMEVSS
jgi:hypothetical protein